MKDTIDLGAINDSPISGTVTQEETQDNIYSYKITGLEDIAFGSTADSTGNKWDYSISEATVDGFNAPLYIKKGETKPTGGASSVGSGGRIQNDQITVALPNTGGSSTHPYTLGGIALIMASALIYSLDRLLKNKA